MKRPSAAPPPNSFEEQWKPRRRTIALFGITMTLVLWLGNACRPCYIGAGSVDISKAFVGMTRHGLQLWGPNTPRATIYLTDHTDERIDGPAWTIRNDELWYWFPSDKSLCRVDASGKRHFMALSKIIPAKTFVVRIYATSQGILLNLSKMNSFRRQELADAAGVIYVPVSNPGRAKQLPGLRDARGSATSEKFCGRDVKGNLVVWANANGPTQTFKQNAADWRYWDFAPQTKRFAFIRDAEVGANDVERVLWTRAGGFSLYGVGFAPNGDIWASEEAMAHTGGVAVLASDTGRFRGWRVKYPGPLSSPFHEIDAKLAELLRKLPHSK